MRDSPSRSLILRLNALRKPLIIRGTMVWPHISRYEIQYMDGHWFIEGREATLSDVDKVVSRMEGHK